MLVKNLMERDIHFMYEATDAHGNVKFEQTNIIAGWTVEIPQETWDKICLQEVTVREYTTEEVEMPEVEVTNISTGSKEKGKKTVKFFTGKKFKTNMVKKLIKDRCIEIIEEKKDELPSRALMERFLKRFNVEVKPQHKDETLFQKVQEIREELDAFK